MFMLEMVVEVMCEFKIIRKLNKEVAVMLHLPLKGAYCAALH